MVSLLTLGLKDAPGEPPTDRRENRSQVAARMQLANNDQPPARNVYDWRGNASCNNHWTWAICPSPRDPGSTRSALSFFGHSTAT